MEKVATYASFKNKNIDSINYFLKQMSNWCIMKNYDYTIYFDKVDNRLDLNRTELNALKTAIKDKKFSKVIVKDITHLSRNTACNMEFLNFLESNNCKIECVDGTDVSLYKFIFEKFSKKKEEKLR